jgi:hypothetical protein
VARLGSGRSDDPGERRGGRHLPVPSHGTFPGRLAPHCGLPIVPIKQEALEFLVKTLQANAD